MLTRFSNTTFMIKMVKRFKTKTPSAMEGFFILSHA